MTILAECPGCHTRQGVRSKQCSCGEDLDKAKKSKRVNFWIDYRIRNGSDSEGNPKYIRR